MQVRVHKNLHQKNWTIQHYIPKKGWRKLAGAKWVRLSGCTFKVNRVEWRKCIQTKRKNVHAWIVGTHYGHTDRELGLGFPLELERDRTRLSYNPLYANRFHALNDYAEPVNKFPQYAECCILTDQGNVYAQGVTFYE